MTGLRECDFSGLMYNAARNREKREPNITAPLIANSSGICLTGTVFADDGYPPARLTQGNQAQRLMIFLNDRRPFTVSFIFVGVPTTSFSMRP